VRVESREWRVESGEWRVESDGGEDQSGVGEFEARGLVRSRRRESRIVRSFHSAEEAAAATEAPCVSVRASGLQTLVTVESARTFNPSCAATIPSGTVDMPITSPPM